MIKEHKMTVRRFLFEVVLALTAALLLGVIIAIVAI
jgi:hypothetical protein